MDVERPVHDRRVDPPDHAEHPLVLPHPKHLLAVRPLDDSGEDGLAGQGPVAGEAEVPLRTAREPGVPQTQVPHLQGRRLVKHLAVIDDQRPEPPAEVEQERRLRPPVGDHRPTQGGRPSDSVIAALGVVREDGPAALYGAGTEGGQVSVGCSGRTPVIQDW